MMVLNLMVSEENTRNNHYIRTRPIQGQEPASRALLFIEEKPVSSGNGHG